MELVNAFKKGDWLTRSSAIVMGLGNILRKQFIKGILFLFTEAAFLFFMAAYGWQCSFIYLCRIYLCVGRCSKKCVSGTGLY